MADSTSSSSSSSSSDAKKKSGFGAFYDKHKKPVLAGLFLFVVVIVYIIVKKSQSTSSTTNGASTSTTASSVPPTYASTGGEYGGGYASDNYGQIQAELATIASDLSNSNSSQAGTPNGNGTGFGQHKWPHQSAPSTTTIALSSWIPGAPESAQPWNADINNIASFYQTTPAAIEALNPQISNFNKIAPGTKINVPVSANAPTNRPASSTS